MVALFGSCPGVLKTDAHVFVVGTALDVDGAELSPYAASRRPVACCNGEGVGELPLQRLALLVEEFRADVRVE